MNMLGVQPQAPHFTITYRLGVAQISDKIPKCWRTNGAWREDLFHLIK
jgi:hypothetical protein